MNEKTMMKNVKVLLLLLLLGFTIPMVSKSDSFVVKGVVTDSISGKPLAGVYITTGKKGTQTNLKGEYILKGLQRGETELRTMYVSTYAQQVISIDLLKNRTINFALVDKPLHLDEIVVTGTRTEKRLSETPILTQVIGKNAIQKSAAVSTTEALQDNIPGMVTSPNAMGNNLKIRGLNSRYILFLVDGERLISEGAGGNVNLDQIDPSTIERVEVVNGASSALYGSNAIGAVVNIITKENHHRLEGGVDAIYESYNTLKTRANIGAKLNKVSIKSSGFRNSSDGYVIKEGAYSAKYEDYGGDLRLGYTPTERTNINVTGRIFSHETFNRSNSTNTTHPQNISVTYGLNGGHTFKGGKNRLSASVNFNHYFDYDILEKMDEKKELDNKIKYMAARAVNTYSPNEKLEWVAGAEYNYESTYATSTLGVVPTTRSIYDGNLFTQADYQPIRNFDIIAGLRYTHNSQFGAAFTPKVAMMYELGAFRFRGSIGSAYRAPSIKELYYDFDHQGMFWVYGNPDLKAEKGLHSSLSAEFSKWGINISVSPYYNNIINKITQYAVIDNGQTNRYYKNVSSATLRGADINIMAQFLKELVFHGNYSYCDAVDNSTGLQLESNVLHSATTSLTWNGKMARSPFSLQIAGRFSSPQIYGSIEEDDKGEEITVYDNSKVYNIWKVAFVKPLRFNKHTVTLTLKVDNIFEFKDTSYINPGRQYLVGIRYAFK